MRWTSTYADLRRRMSYAAYAEVDHSVKRTDQPSESVKLDQAAKLRFHPTRNRVVARSDSSGGGSRPSSTFGLHTRRSRWSRCLPYAAAQALHYSIPLLRAWSPEKRPAPDGPSGFDPPDWKTAGRQPAI
jgi:hypothetical protein